MKDADNLSVAIILACQAHATQRDKGGEPYILHPLRVMLKMPDEARRIAAVLHDTIEDCGLELSLIRHRFGSEVSDAVDALSRREGETYDDFIDRCAENEIARDVKFFDLEDNSDLSRLPLITGPDLRRTDKYHRAKFRLLTAIADQSPKGRDATRLDGASHAGAVAKPIANTSLPPNPEQTEQ